MLFIKTLKCFTVHCSFTLPAGAWAVIPVSEGSDEGQCWPVGVAAHHKSTKPLRTTLQLLSSLMGSLGGESQGWWGLRYLASLPRAIYHVGCSKYVAHAQTAAAAFTPPDTQRKTTKIGVWKLNNIYSHPGCQCSPSPSTFSASPQLDPVESDPVCNSATEYEMMESCKPLRLERRRWMLTIYPSWLELHCWICFGVSQRYSWSRWKRLEWEKLNLESQ